jgi:hypothetical protein
MIRNAEGLCPSARPVEGTWEVDPSDDKGYQSSAGASLVHPHRDPAQPLFVKEGFQGVANAECRTPGARCRQPPGPHSWGKIRQIWGHPRPRSASGPPQADDSRGSGNPGVGWTGRSEIRRHSLLSSTPVPLCQRGIPGSSRGCGNPCRSSEGHALSWPRYGAAFRQSDSTR